MRNIEDLRRAFGETEDRVYQGMSMAELFAVFIEYVDRSVSSVDDRMTLLDSHLSGEGVRFGEQIASLDKLTQELYRMLRILEQESVKKKPALPHWSDLPR